MIFEILVNAEWVTAFVVGIIGAVGAAIAAYRRGQASQSVQLAEPVPPIPTTKVFSPPTWDQHKGLSERVTRLEMEFAAFRAANERQFHALMEAGAMRENRLADKLDEIAGKLHARIDKQLDYCRENSARCVPTHHKA